MKRAKWNSAHPMRGTIRLLLFLSPLLALPHFARQLFSEAKPAIASGSGSSQTGSESSKPEAVPSPSSSPWVSNETSDVAMEVDVPLYFWGIPLHCLSDSLKRNPRAPRFRVHWETSDPGSSGYYTIWYNRTKHTLKYWSYDTWWEAGIPQRSEAVYQKVTDSIINRIAAKDPSEHDGTISDLPSYGCTCTERSYRLKH